MPPKLPSRRRKLSTPTRASFKSVGGSRLRRCWSRSNPLRRRETSGNRSSDRARYNSATLLESAGKIVGTYDKMHRVMFGEYIPFADWIPSLYKLTPLTGGIIAGTAPSPCGPARLYCVAPNICYETAIPHVIRRQVATLTTATASMPGRARQPDERRLVLGFERTRYAPGVRRVPCRRNTLAARDRRQRRHPARSTRPVVCNSSSADKCRTTCSSTSAPCAAFSWYPAATGSLASVGELCLLSPR